MNINSGDIKGLDRLNALLRAMPDAVKGAVVAQLREDLLDLQGKAQAKAPYDLGDLEGSAESDAKPTFLGVEGYVSFDRPYATIQHEMNFHHDDPNRTWKYLETPLKSNINKYISNISAIVKKEVDHR